MNLKSNYCKQYRKTFIVDLQNNVMLFDSRESKAERSKL